MRTILVSLCLSGALTAPLIARVDGFPFDLAVILQFQGPHASASIQEMEREADRILNPSGVRLRWVPLGADPAAIYSDLVVLTFTGSCDFDRAATKADASTSYAFMWFTNGKMQPFGQINCDRVVESARGAMLNADSVRADQLVGRAMGRVVAHELVHVLTGSQRHGTEGVAKSALSGQDLIGESLTLSMWDLVRVKLETRKLLKSGLARSAAGDTQPECRKTSPTILRVHAEKYDVPFERFRADQGGYPGGTGMNTECR